MAKQCGSHLFTGKMGATIGYLVNGEYLERENGSKEGKAFISIFCIKQTF